MAIGSDMPPRISVLMPVFNAASTLGPAIASIQAQTQKDWELLLADDGSTDGSRELAETLAKGDPRIRLLPGAHEGIVPALRRAAARARGAYLARMDADDISLPERFDLQLACFEKDAGLGLCGGCVRMTGSAVGFGRSRYEAWINALATHEDIQRELFVECPLPHPTFMIKRRLYDQTGGYQDHGWPEDYDLVFRCWRAGARFAKPGPVILEWADHSTRLSMTSPCYQEAAFRAVKRHYLAMLEPVKSRALYQWGAGEVGKRWLREWGSLRPRAVVDINPRKIGRTIHHFPVIPPQELPRPGGVFILITVGAPGAREEIRDWLIPRGFVEGEDFLFLA